MAPRSCVTDPRWRKLVSLYRYDWTSAADVLFGKIPTWQQDEIIESVQEPGSKTSVSSGHGTGKSDNASILIMLFLIMFPGARAILVANKIQQVRDGIFKYIKINWATATSRFPWLANYFVLTETSFYEITGKGVWTVIPKGFRLGNEEALAGEHADHLLYIIDEASGVSDKAFGIITGALTGIDNRILLLSQPTRPSGYFYDSHHKLAKRPGNPNGIYTAITLNSEESPLVTADFIKMKLAEYGGRDNPMYLIKVRGLFPKTQDGFLLGRDEVERATRRKVKIAKGWGWIACVDVAGGTGRDKSVINIMMVSGDRNKRRIIAYRIIEYTDVTETQLAAKINAECSPDRYPNISIVIDGDGLGKSTADLLYDNYGITAQRIRWGKKMHSREDRSLYFDQRAFANIQAAEAVKSGRMRLDKGDATIDEASKIPVGINAAGQWKVMTKEDMKKKLNLRSPDHWDTYCFATLANYVPQNEVLSVEDEAQVDEALAWLNE
ncbi:terminase [Salmonella enterica]|nr:terminase [Salmonella enterica]EIA0033912.1 terminase [Salmonella enterica]